MRRLMVVLFACALVLAACGDDGGDDDVSTNGGGGGPVTFDDLVGKTFASTSTTGHDLVEDTVISLTFIEGRISALAGCNTQNGNADVADGKLVVDTLASTMMGCDQPLMEQDQWLSGFLEGDPDVALDGETLTLTSGDEAIELAEQAA